MRKQKTDLSTKGLKVSTELLRALAHPLRLEILGFIDQHERVHVNKIYNTLNLEQSITSQHLRILRTSNLVRTEREGKFIYYSLNYDKIGNAIDAIRNFMND